MKAGPLPNQTTQSSKDDGRGLRFFPGLADYTGRLFPAQIPIVSGLYRQTSINQYWSELITSPPLRVESC